MIQENYIFTGKFLDLRNKLYFLFFFFVKLKRFVSFKFIAFKNQLIFDNDLY